jgi:hypothetical protein
MKNSKSNSFSKRVILSISICLFIITTAFSQTSQCILNVKNDRAYFHDRTTLNGKVSYTQRKAFLVMGDQVTINCQDKNENWIYISYKNSKGTITRGYIKKADLENAQTNNLSTKEILSKLVGEHYLESISGFAGANALYDYEKKNGKWTASGSSINAGTREGYKITISAQDLSRLNTMKLVLNQDLSLQLYVGNKLIITAPFSDNDVDNKAIILLERQLKESELGFTVGDYIDEEENTILLTYDIEKRVFSLFVSGFSKADYTFK